jgi:hypothetical protein
LLSRRSSSNTASFFSAVSGRLLSNRGWRRAFLLRSPARRRFRVCVFGGLSRVVGDLLVLALICRLMSNAWSWRFRRRVMSPVILILALIWSRIC